MPLTTGIPASVIPQAAELAILEAFDLARHNAGHDYGNGQRANELSRRRTELALAIGNADVEVDGGRALRYDRHPHLFDLDVVDELIPAGDLERAFRRIAGPRLARIQRGSYRNVSRASALAAWDNVRTLVNDRVAQEKAKTIAAAAERFEL